MPSQIQVDKIIDSGATSNKELAEYSSSAWSWGAGVPSGSVLQIQTDVYAPTSGSIDITDTEGFQIGASNLKVTITCSSTSNKLLIQCLLPAYSNNDENGRGIEGGFQYSTNSDLSSNALLGQKKWPFARGGYVSGSSGQGHTGRTLNWLTVADVPSTSTIYIAPYMKAFSGSDVKLFTDVNADDSVATLVVTEIKG